MPREGRTSAISAGPVAVRSSRRREDPACGSAARPERGAHALAPAMARIAFAWEHGGELGHAMACSALARVLRARGHHIAFIFRELQPLSLIPGTSAYEVFQAPVYPDEGRGAPIPVSYADTLPACGYGDARHVTGLLGRWLALLEGWKPDLLVADMSPTALLAARLLRLKRVAHGNGFAIPPRLSPPPAFRLDSAV